MKKIFLFTTAFLCVVIHSYSQTIEFSDDFEFFTNNWVFEGSWGITSVQSSSGNQSLADSPSGNYLPNQNISVTMNTGVDLTNAPNAEVKFVAIYDIEPGNFDFCYLEASADGGSNWSTLATFLGESNTTPWVEYTYSLIDYVGNSDVKIRFRFDSDGATEYDGIYIDDFYIFSLEADETPPGVVHSPPGFYESYIGDVNLTANLIDDSGILFAFLRYTVDGGLQQTVAGSNTIDETWTFMIPQQTEGAQIDYYLEIRDDSPNANNTITDVYSYIAGHHVFYDNGDNDAVTSIGPASSSGLDGAAVKITLNGTTDVIYALIRNYADQNSSNDDFMFHVWTDDNGMPGTDIITPFSVTPEADLIENSPMTRIDLSGHSAELSGMTGDFFIGFTVPTGESHVTQTSPGIANRSYDLNGTSWSLNTQNDYHFRVITTQFETPDLCPDAADLTSMIGQGPGIPQTSPLWDNSNATTSGNEPGNGVACWIDNSIDRPIWYTFVGDGATYQIKTTNCNGTASNYIDDGDAQIAIYSGNDCGNLTPVICDDDGNVEPDIYAPFVEFETTAGTTYYMMADGYSGAAGEFCIEILEVLVVTCAEISIGNSSGESDICFNQMTSFNINNLVIPTISESGFDWIVSSADITGSSDPYNESSFVNYMGYSSTAFTPEIVNDGNQIPFGTYFFTPVTFGSATDTNGTPFGFDFSNGCIESGISIEVTLHGTMNDLSADTMSVEATLPGNNGQASVTNVAGGSGSWTYNWSNGGSTSTITGLSAGEYTVTISDDSGCVQDLVLTIIVGGTTSVDDLEFEQAIQLYPNPAESVTSLIYDFKETVDLKMTMTNTMGQVVEQNLIGNAINGTIEIKLDKYPEGIYFLLLTDGNHQSSKRLVVRK